MPLFLHQVEEIVNFERFHQKSVRAGAKELLLAVFNADNDTRSSDYHSFQLDYDRRKTAVAAFCRYGADLHRDKHGSVQQRREG